MPPGSGICGKRLYFVKVTKNQCVITARGCHHFNRHHVPTIPKRGLEQVQQGIVQMNFKDWMLHQGLSESSTRSYVGAIQGPLSAWAIENDLLSGPLISMTSTAAFKEVDSKIRVLPVFLDRNSTGHHMYSSALAQFAQYLADDQKNDIESDIDTIFEDQNLDETERRNLVKSRIGQGIFRQRLLAHWKQCAVTGFDDTGLLVASHIKPWRSSNNSERLDGFNGLLLTPNLDKAFDAGLITFDSGGRIKVSPRLKNYSKLGITSEMRVELSPDHEPFMTFHRAHVFHSA
jgi:putative restriction endonuclease